MKNITDTKSQKNIKLLNHVLQFTRITKYVCIALVNMHT